MEQLRQIYFADVALREKPNPKHPDLVQKINKGLQTDNSHRPICGKHPKECQYVEQHTYPPTGDKTSAYMSKTTFRQTDGTQKILSRHCDTVDLEDALNNLDVIAKTSSVDDLIFIFQKCRRKENLTYAKRIYAHICIYGLELRGSLGNYILPMLVECGSMLDAQIMFGRLAHPKEHSWTSLISGYIRCGQSQHAFKLYEKMQEDKIHPSCHTLTALLNACATLKDLNRGRKIHLQITEKGLKTDSFVDSALVDMYVKCGSQTDAREVFDTLSTQNVVSWNALIAGYAENGPLPEALNCYEQMQEKGISPNVITFSCVLKACVSIGSISKGRELHFKISEKGFQRDLIIGNTLINMYAKHGSLNEAQEVFDKLPRRDIVSWSALIAGYAERGPYQEALRCFRQMHREGVSPNAATFLCALKAVGNIRAIEEGRELHAEITKTGFDRDLVVNNTLVDMYSKCGALLEAKEVFDKLPIRTVVSWTALIAGYAEHGHGNEALEHFERMELDGISPDPVAFMWALKACGNIGAIKKGEELHVKITKMGFEKDVHVGSTLMDMYVKCALISKAREVFDKLPVCNNVSWNVLIAGYVEHGLDSEAIKCFEEMKLKGISADAVTFTCVLKACGNLGAIDKGQELHAMVRGEKYGGDVRIGNTLIAMYSKCGSLLEARRVFAEMPVRDIVSWSALIDGYAEHGHGQEALKCFEHMKTVGIQADAVTFMSALKACGNLGAISKGQKIHTEMKQKDFDKNLPAGNALLDMYVKCGSLEMAREVFDRLQLRDVVSWTSMIKGYGMNHEGKMAVQCFEQMQNQKMTPNSVTFTCLLTACSRANLVTKGQEYFKSMIEEFSIVPTSEHYTCMVLLLARSGHLHEAQKFLQGMPYSASEDMWTVLLSACSTFGEIDLGKKCFKELVRMNSANACSYVLMANLYASTGKQNDAHRIEGLRTHASAMKIPASACIEVQDEVHEFAVGEKQSDELLEMLEMLSSRLRQEGHVPNLDLVLRPISDDAKETALCGHAEKFAIAFGLLNTPQGQTLRVTKNLRMCNDCHNTSKIISRIERREIIIRDTYCIHQFKEGLCSCGDML